jgi:phospholipid/cholesterol/gamma-HCH transport system ATP-binding protein
LRKLGAELRQTRERRPVTSVVVTHEMKTVRRIADRVVMLFPLAQLDKDEGQVIFDGAVDGLEGAGDERVRRFVV